MLRYIGFRLFQMVPVLFGVSVVAFLLLRLIPGDPAVAMLGLGGTPAAIARIHQEMGLDKPLWEQYWIFLTGALHGNFGDSFTYRTGVFGITLRRIPLSVELITFAAIQAV